jgi:hypothetical protein
MIAVPPTMRPSTFRVVGTDRSAVTLAVMRAAHGGTVTLEVERTDWLDALCDGRLPFAAPALLPLLHQALRAERLDILPLAHCPRLAFG